MPDTDSDLLTGLLHVYVAFDWGDEINLDRARQCGPAVFLDMARRPRTPASLAYRVPPLRFTLGPVVVSMPGLASSAIHSESVKESGVDRIGAERAVHP